MAVYPGHKCRAFRLMRATLQVTNMLQAPYMTTGTPTGIIVHIPSLALKAVTLT